MDRMIGSIALDRLGKRNSPLPSFARYAAQLGRPKHAVTQRARKLGFVAEKKEPDWSASELRVLTLNSWMTPMMIQRRLTKAGFTRSLVSVTLKRKRLRLHAAREWLNARELAEALGIDSHKVAQWTKAGLLKHKWRQFEGNGSGIHRGEYVFTTKAIRTFIFAHDGEIDLRKVDHRWFFDIVKFGHQ